MDLISQLREDNQDKLRGLIAERGELLEQVADRAVGGDSDWLYRFILKFLTNLDFNEEEAKNHYFRLIEHRCMLNEKLGRDAGLRVATLDYFTNVQKLMKNPRIVEIDFFEEMLKTGREDPKTGCYNARTLQELAVREFKRAERYNQKVSFVIIDVDNFKHFNDRFGHLFGDRILKVFTDIIKLSVREEDIVARFGGDEFAVVMPQTGRVGARSLAERMKQRLLDHFREMEYQGKRVEVTFSAGIATFPLDGQDYESILRASDVCLYQSKSLGKNRIYDRLENQTSAALPDGEDRRKYTRYRFLRTAAARMSRPGVTSNWNGTVIDISPRGMLLHCTDSSASDYMRAPMQIKLDRIGDREIPSVQLRGKVVRVFGHDENCGFLVGMEFAELLDYQKWNIFEHYGDLEPA
jgi:diguanylate cyclase (GGDEF)-like protein